MVFDQASVRAGYIAGRNSILAEAEQFRSEMHAQAAALHREMQRLREELARLREWHAAYTVELTERDETTTLH